MLEEVGHALRLPDPRGAKQGDQPARAVGDCVLVLATEPRSLSLAADQHAVEVARHGLRARDHLEKPESLDRL